MGRYVNYVVIGHFYLKSIGSCGFQSNWPKIKPNLPMVIISVYPTHRFTCFLSPIIETSTRICLKIPLTDVLTHNTAKF